MGGICSKGVRKNDIVAEAHSVQKESAKSLCQLVSSSNKEEAEATPQREIELVAKTPSKPRASHGVVVPLDNGEKKKVMSVCSTENSKEGDHNLRGVDHGVGNECGQNLGIVDVANGFSGEHVAAGWPDWLTAVAEEAVKGWLPRRADSFEKLNKIGQGTYSSVYKARDLETGKIVALKKVRFANMDPESVRFMAREIHILRRLDHPNVIKLEGIITSRLSCSLYLVFEYMDHDLAGLAAIPGIKFTEPQVKCFMHQLLSGLQHCHDRGVLHRDIKGSNLLVDSNGVLRIGDFGLAATFDPNKKQSLTSRVVTLWYRPPELLLGATEYDVAVDLWSVGCILAELFAGKPIMPGRTEVEQLHKIFKLCGSPAEDYWTRSKLSNATIFKPQHPYPRCVAETFKDFPSSALALLDSLLAIEPTDRGTSASALQSDLFTTKPFACDPSSLPKFRPSKEYDARLRDEEARRQREAATKVQGSEVGSKGPRDQKARAVQDGNREKQKRQPNPKSCSEKYNPDGSVTGFRIAPRSPVENQYPRAGTSVHPSAYGTSRNKGRDADNRTNAGHCSSALRESNVPHLTTQRSHMPHLGAVSNSTNAKCNRLDVTEPSDKKHTLDRPSSSSHKKDESVGGKDSTMAYGNKNRRIQYSGPLMPPGGNMEDMLKEHERQIQQAVRKARLDKARSKKDF